MINIAYTENAWGATKPLTLTAFEAMINSPRTEAIIDVVRSGHPEDKRQLPAICWQADHYENNKRTDANAVLNGLFALDIDHIGDEVEPLALRAKERADELDIVCIHRSPSGDGLRIVALCQPEFNSIAENQAWLAAKLNTTYDAVCCDPARMYFITKAEEFYYVNKELWE